MPAPSRRRQRPRLRALPGPGSITSKCPPPPSGYGALSEIVEYYSQLRLIELLLCSIREGGLHPISETMRRLHPRGPLKSRRHRRCRGRNARPDCVLKRTPEGYRCVTQEEAAGAIQALATDRADDPDWLFRQCHRIVKALADQNIALAQIYGMGIPIIELDKGDESGWAALRLRTKW